MQLLPQTASSLHMSQPEGHNNAESIDDALLRLKG
jgi:hypothetical protein